MVHNTTMALLAFLLLIPLTSGYAILLSKYWGQIALDKRMVAYKLAFPRDLDVDSTVDWLHSITGTLRPKNPFGAVPTIVLEQWSTGTGLSYRLLVPHTHQRYVLGQLERLTHGVTATPDDQYPRRRWTHGVELGLTVTSRNLNITIDKADVIANSITQSLVSDLSGHEAVLMQWVISAADREHKPIHGQTPTAHRNVFTLLNGTMASKDEVNDRRDKLDEPNLRAVLRVAAHANTKTRAEHLIEDVKKALQARASVSTRFHKRIVGLNELQKRIDNTAAPFKFGMQIRATELAALIGWPYGAPAIPGLPMPVSRTIPATEVVPREGIVLGRSNVHGRERPIAVSLRGAVEHIQITGQTGAGKTVLMTNIAAQAIKQGCGLVVIEPAGDLVNSVLNTVPEERMKDVILLDLADKQFPVGFNILQQGNTATVISELEKLFESLTDLKSMWTSQVLHYSLRTLATDRKFTITDLMPLLVPMTDDERAWRAELIKSLRDPDLINYWRDFDSLKPGDQQSRIRPTVDRIWQIISRPALRNVLGQSESSFQMSDVLSKNKILLVKLSGTEDDSANSILGTLIFNALWSAARTIPKPDKPNFLMMDEFARFMRLPISTEELLAEARKHNLNMTFAHQHLHQLSDNVKHGVRANARTKIFFMADSEDARTMADQMGNGVDQDQMMHLPTRTAMVRVAIDGGVSEAMTMAMEPPAPTFNKANVIREMSRGVFGRDVSEVQKAQLERRTPTDPKAGGRFARASDW